MYKESQSFVTIWFIIVAVLMIVGLGYSVSNQFSDAGEWVFNLEFVIVFVIILGLSLIRLKTRVDDKGISIQFIPFVFNRLWKWEDIQEVYIRKYSFMDYGGWGYRFNSQGTAFTTKGKYGVQIVLKNGKRILVGTQNPDELRFYIENRIVK